jgi:hypothetical protein
MRAKTDTVPVGIRMSRKLAERLRAEAARNNRWLGQEMTVLVEIGLAQRDREKRRAGSLSAPHTIVEPAG